MTSSLSNRVPGIWQAVRWAMQPRAEGGGTSRARLVWRVIESNLLHGTAMRRWIGEICELHARHLVHDLPGEYLRAVRPFVHGGVGYAERVAQLVGHRNWLEAAFHPNAFAPLAFGEPVVLLELGAPPGYDYMRLQLRQAPVQSPEGELLLTVTLCHSAEVQRRPQPIDAGVLAFSRFCIEGTPCLVIGGVRGQRKSDAGRVSTAEIAQALHGWKPSVLLVRVAQELAGYWNLKLVGLDPAAHRLHGWSYRWNRRKREAGERIFGSYRALWAHFEAHHGPHGWVSLPLSADEKLAAIALSPEKRSRQTRRADYWIRTRNQLRIELREFLQQPAQEAQASRPSQGSVPSTQMLPQENGLDAILDEDVIFARVLQTGPASLL